METISDSTGIRGSVESMIGGRQENQDSYGMAETRIGMLVVVCDGMGGGPAGKTASMIATQAIIDYVSGATDEKSPVSVLEDAAVSANESVLAEVAKNPALKGMGTTCVCVLIRKNQTFVMHVGDSRCYQIRGNGAVFRTADHSYVGELVRRGAMTEEDARNSKYSNVITKAIGAGPEIEPEVDTVSIRPGDRFALMSDGIWGAMPEPELVGLLAYNADPAQLVPEIAARVDDMGRLQGGGHDNLTLALVDLPGSKSAINDVFSANLASRPTKNRVKAENPDYDYELTENKNPGSKKKKSAGSLTVWLLGVALLAAVCVIVWLVAFKDKAEPVSTAKAVEVADSIASARKDSLSVLADNKKSDESEISGKDELKDKAKENIASYTDKTGIQNDAGVSANKVFTESVESLKKLREHRIKGFTSKDKESVESDRRRMYNDIYDRLSKAEISEQDSKRKGEISKVLKAFKSNEKKVVIVDKGQGRTTKDGENAIDDLIRQLNKLAK